MLREGIPKRSAAACGKPRKARAVETRFNGRGDWGRQSEADAMQFKDLVKWASIEWLDIAERTVDKSS